MNRVPKAVVASIPRTGSTLVCELLAQHPQVLGFGEIFIHEPTARKFFNRQGSGETRCYPGPDKLDEYLDYLTAVANLEGKKVISFKLMDYQEAKLWALLGIDIKASFIHVNRFNALECLASSMLSEKTGVWHARTPEDQERAGQATVEVSIEELWKAHNRALALSDYLCGYPHPKLRVSYDALVDNPQRIASQMFEFLGLPDADVKLTQGKLNLRPIQERVSNYEDLKQATDGTPLAAYFA